MAKIIYLEDRINGLHCYTPEMGQRKPDVKLEARLSHYGNHYIVDTPLELKGRGITKQEVCWWLAASSKLKTGFPIVSLKRHLKSCKHNTQYQWNVCLIKHYTGGTAAARKEKVK